MFKKIKLSIFLIIALFSTLSIFSDGNFHDTIVDFKNDVVDFSETGLMDNIRGGELVNISPLDLKVGDIFIDVDGAAKKVASIEENKEGIIINTVQPGLREVFEFFDIPPQTIDITTTDNLVADSVPAGTIIEQADRSYEEIELAKFEKTIGDDNASVTIGAHAKIGIGVDVGGRLPYSYLDTKDTWKFWKWEWRYVQGYIQGEFNYNVTIGANFEAQAKFSKELNVPIVAFSTGGGLDAGVGLFSKSSIEGSISLKDDFEISLKGNAGAICGLDGWTVVCWPVNIQSYGGTIFSVRNELTIDAKVELKEKVYLGLFVKLFGFSVLEADAGGGPYMEFNANISGWIEYNTSNNPKLQYGWSASGSGEIGLFVDINASVIDGKWGGNLYYQKFPFWSFEKKVEGGNATGNIVGADLDINMQ